MIHENARLLHGPVPAYVAVDLHVIAELDGVGFDNRLRAVLVKNAGRET